MDIGSIILFIIFGTIIIFPVVDAFYFYKVTIKKWNCVEGEIIKNSPVDDGDGGWTREIIYAYNVHGVEYTGNRITKNQINVPFEYRSTYRYYPIDLQADIKALKDRDKLK